MTKGTLVVLMGDREVGRVERGLRSRLSFRYDDGWWGSNEAVALSVSMPLSSVEHGHDRVEAFLWGLLPDNDRVLDRWARGFQVSAASPFGLVSHVGEDCPGAVQFVRPERLAAVRTSGPPEVDWLDERGIGERLALLRTDASAWRVPGDAGQFSLAGAQPKTALFFADGRWGIPSGRTPTTHVLKPAHGEFAGHIENEHFCLALARELGLPAASSEVRRFGGEPAIVVERYDRIRTADLAAAAAAESAARAAALSALAKTQPVLRLHQEDVCQALGLRPTSKYESEGGPGAAAIVSLLRTHSSRPAEDVDTFLDALGFAWLTAGTDAHAKNFSLLHASGGRVRLAPLYDLASALPYDFDPHRLRLAMRVGGKYRLRDVGARQWRGLATEARVDPHRLRLRLSDLAARLPEAAEAVRGRATAAGLDGALIRRLADLLSARAERCRRALAA